MKTEIKKSKIHGIGIFATKCIFPDEVIEVCQIISLSKEDTEIIDKTSLYNYYFSWENGGSAISLGNGSIYNHSYEPNSFYRKDFLNNVIVFIALKPIKKNEEILVNYNGNPHNKEKVWFDK